MSAAGGESSDTYLTSPATPTTTPVSLLKPPCPNRTGRPIGSRPGHHLAAAVWRTMTARRVFRLSAIPKVRPPTIGTRIVANQAGDTQCTETIGRSAAGTGARSGNSSHVRLHPPLSGGQEASAAAVTPGNDETLVSKR